MVGYVGPERFVQQSLELFVTERTSQRWLDVDLLLKVYQLGVVGGGHVQFRAPVVPHRLRLSAPPGVPDCKCSCTAWALM